MFKIASTLHTRRQQLILAGGLAGVVVVLVIGVLYVFDTSVDKHVQGCEAQPQAVEIESSGKRINAEEVWRYRIEDDHKQVLAELTALKNSLKQPVKPVEPDALKELQEKLTALEAEFNYQKMGQDVAHDEALSAQAALGQPLQSPLHSEAPSGHPCQENGSQIHKVTLNLGENPHAKAKAPIKTVDNTIPAGAFAQAVLLGGVDASTAMTSASDPRPVLLRILDQGNLPRRFKSDLQDCRCIASAYGDLSSERVYLRLEKLTCTERTTGEIIETQVAGYVAGEDGRAGIRGTVVSKDLSYLQNRVVVPFCKTIF